MRRLGSLLIIGLLLSTPFTVFISTASAASKAKGVIRDVDLAAGTVTIATRDGSITLRTDDRTEITRNGEPAALSDLQMTDKAQARFDRETLLARVIDARGSEDVNFARVEGAISVADEAAHSLTIVPMREGQPVTLNITDDTYITLDGRQASLADLARGFSAGAAFDPDTLDAVRVQAESFAEVRGVIRDVNASLGTLTIAIGEGDRSITLNVSPGTPVSLNDRPATLDDLRHGFEVIASYVEVSLTAVRIAAHSRAEVQGLIRDVDLSGSTVAITPLVEGPAVQLHVTESTVLTLNGAPARLNDLKTGMAAAAVFSLGSFDAISIAARSESGADCTVVGVAGSVVRVDVEGNRLVVDPAEAANDVILNVTTRTEITLNGRPARLSDLRPGMRVEARFCRESLNALAIAAHSEGGDDCTLLGIAGSIARVDVDGGHLAINPATADAQPVTLNVVERTAITLNGRPARLSDLRPGMRVEARFCRETLNAAIVAAVSESRTECTAAGVSGSITGVDPSGGHLGVTTGPSSSPVVLNITERTDITLDGHPVRLSDLRAGMRVEARFCRETLNAIVIAATAGTR